MRVSQRTPERVVPTDIRSTHIVGCGYLSVRRIRPLCQGVLDLQVVMECIVDLLTENRSNERVTCHGDLLEDH
jgi:hypothetical protein